MKKLLLATIITTGSISFISCKKTFTCECTVTDSTGLSPAATASTTIEAKKGEAETVCESGSSIMGQFTTTCKLK